MLHVQGACLAETMLTILKVRMCGLMGDQTFEVKSLTSEFMGLSSDLWSCEMPSPSQSLNLVFQMHRLQSHD